MKRERYEDQSDKGNNEHAEARARFRAPADKKGGEGEGDQGFELGASKEHYIVTDYPLLSQALQPLREQGISLAIDDAGAGYASMRHIVNLQPDFIKLDMSLTRDLDKDVTRRALAEAMIAFSKEIGSKIVDEEVGITIELEVLRSLNVDSAQGYIFGDQEHRKTREGAILRRSN